ncbi:response regulator [Natronorubrum tibetense]|uniref:Response regulator receiver protein n=1 Tax=Natronorubrum tibetense GA33 TaxID=1114856 RepID=L9VMV0_9EURY|nr:response regulator [Natronorubrum tibetense]ELY38391.1 response regulator receiver protein [Natronorubrum tibetense GA33]
MTDRIDDPITVLLVEDNPGDVRLIRDAFEQLSTETTIHVATDGDEALEFLTECRDSDPDSVPDLVLLDLNLPRMTGLEFLETIKDDATLARIPVLVLTSSEAVEDVLDSYELSANAYLTKPTDPDEYAAMVEAVAEFWLQKAALPPIFS